MVANIVCTIARRRRRRRRRRRGREDDGYWLDWDAHIASACSACHRAAPSTPSYGMDIVS